MGNPGAPESIWRNPTIRRVEAAFLGFSLGESAGWLATLVYAFDRGGVDEAGVVAVASLLLGMVVAPFAAFAGDRFRSDRVLSTGYAVHAVLLGSTAIGIAIDHAPMTYAAAIGLSASLTVTRPVMGAVLPAITSRPAELVRVNGVTGATENLGATLGPLLAAALFALAGTGSVFAVFAMLAAISTILTWNLGLRHTSAGASGGVRDLRGVGIQIVGGLRAFGHDHALALLVISMSAGALSLGIADIVSITLAEDRLGAGGGVAGLLVAGVGAGAVAGALAAPDFIGRGKLIRPFAISAALLSLPFVAMAGMGELVPMLLVFALVGFGESLVRVTGAVALQRRSQRNLLVRIFGIYESLRMLAMAIGALVVPLLVRSIGLDRALVAIGLGVLVVAATAVAALSRRLGDFPPPSPELVDRLLADPLFAPLDVLAIESLAANVQPCTAAAGEVIITEGEPGDRYYLVNDGTVTVTTVGEPSGELGPGSSFGEIALLRDVPRQATVVAATPVELLSIDRDAFLEAVTGHPQSSTTADQVVEEYLRG